MAKIQDGKGTGYMAAVNTDQRLTVASVSTQVSRWANAEKGKAFMIHTGTFTYATGGERPMVYLANTSALDSIVVDSVEINNNGGNTNYNKPMHMRFYAGMATPSANYTALTPINLNTKSGNTMTATIYKWDGVSTGMTVASNGMEIYSIITGVGMTSARADSGLIIAPGGIVGLTIQGPETGNAVLTMFTHILQE